MQLLINSKEMISKCSKLLSFEKNWTYSSVGLPNKESIAYRVTKSPNPRAKQLIFIHINSTASSSWGPLISHLQGVNEQFETYCIDLRGYGLSSFVAPIESTEDFAADLDLFIKALGLRPSAIIGSSIGSIIAMKYATNPSFDSESLEHIFPVSALPFGGYVQSYEDGATKEKVLCLSLEQLKKNPYIIQHMDQIKNKDEKFIMEKWRKEMFVSEIPDECLEKFYSGDSFRQRGYAEARWTWTTFNMSEKHNGVVKGSWEEFKNLRVPVTLIHSDKDACLPVEVSLENKRLLERHCPTPHDLKIIEDAGHMIAWDKPEEFASVILGKLGIGEKH